MSKPKEILLKRPLRVIQVYRNACMFQKGDLAPGQNRDFLEWPEKIPGMRFVSNAVLQMPEGSDQLDRINQYDLLFLLDDFSGAKDQLTDWIEEPVVFSQANSQNRLRCLRLRQKEDAMEVFLNASDYAWWPKRESHKLCELRKDVPVEIRINGKMDGYHQRYYMEEQFILEDLGFVEQIRISRKPDSVLKKAPLDCKLVDLRVMLW